MKEIISRMSLISIILFYLFMCGTIYLIAFWTTFNFDITNYVDFIDIPKSFIYPFAESIGISLIMSFTLMVGKSLDKIKNDEERDKLLSKQDIKQIPTKTLLSRVLLNYHIWVILILYVCFIFYKPRREWVYGVSGSVIMIYGITMFIKENYFLKSIPQYSGRLFLYIFIWMVPIYTFLIGKFDAIAVWENRKFHEVSKITFLPGSSDITNWTSYKLLGKLGGFLLLTDRTNSKLTALRVETFQSVEFQYRSLK